MRCQPELNIPGQPEDGFRLVDAYAPGRMNWCPKSLPVSGDETLYRWYRLHDSRRNGLVTTYASAPATSQTQQQFSPNITPLAGLIVATQTPKWPKNSPIPKAKIHPCPDSTLPVAWNRFLSKLLTHTGISSSETAFRARTSPYNHDRRLALPLSPFRPDRRQKKPGDA